MAVMTLQEIESVLRSLIEKYHAKSAILFGSYARGEATPESDIDVIIVGGNAFVPKHIFALAEELREITGRSADVFEQREVISGTTFYDNVMQEGIEIA